jgi:hypothetical protein
MVKSAPIPSPVVAGRKKELAGRDNKYNFFVKNYRIDKTTPLSYNQAAILHPPKSPKLRR